MNCKSFLLALIFALTPVLSARNTSTQVPMSGRGSQTRAERRQNKETFLCSRGGPVLQFALYIVSTAPFGRPYI
jgi:hypothetical protein